MADGEGRTAASPVGGQQQQQQEEQQHESDSPFISSTFLVWSTKPSLIDQGLYLGGYESVSDKDYLLSINVKAILTVANGLRPLFPHLFTYTVIDVEDDYEVDISVHFDECFKAIDDGLRQGSVVVHCMAGVSRSVTVVVAYLMKARGMRMQEALAYVRKARPIAHPNYGFLKRLEKFEETLEQEKAQQGKL